MSSDGAPGCRCLQPVITLRGMCTICGKERVHIRPKVAPFVTSYVPPNEAA